MLYVIIRSQVMAFMCKAIKHETKEEKKQQINEMQQESK